jgi:acetate kinase
MRELLAQENHDIRAAEAVALFCYQAKKWIGAFAAALGGFENLPSVRARICEGLGFPGIELSESRNAETSGVISTDNSRATVRVIRTDEDPMIARTVFRLLETGAVNEKKGLKYDNRYTYSGSAPQTQR